MKEETPGHKSNAYPVPLYQERENRIDCSSTGTPQTGHNLLEHPVFPHNTKVTYKLITFIIYRLEIVGMNSAQRRM